MIELNQATLGLKRETSPPGYTSGFAVNQTALSVENHEFRK